MKAGPDGRCVHPEIGSRYWRPGRPPPSGPSFWATSAAVCWSQTQSCQRRLHGPMSSSGARFGIWFCSNSTAGCHPPTGEWSFQVLHREVWTRVLGTGRARTAHELLEGVIDRGLQNRTDAEEAARREALQDPRLSTRFYRAANSTDGHLNRNIAGAAAGGAAGASSIAPTQSRSHPRSTSIRADCPAPSSQSLASRHGKYRRCSHKRLWRS